MTDLSRLLGILGEVRARLVRILLVLVPIFGFTITFRLVPVPLGRLGPVPIALAYPFPNPFDNVTAQVFRALAAWTLPPGVQVINVGIGDSVVVQLEIGLLITVAVGMPWIVHEVGAFLMPALRRRERDLLKWVGVPASALFAVGFLLGVLVFTPLTVRLLFRYVDALGLVPVIGAQQFVTFALLYSIAFGVVFELPVFIYTLTRLGVVRAGTWRKHWRAAIIGSLVFGMIVTPANSGITMVLVALPMVGLYLAGLWFARRWERRGVDGGSPVGVSG